MVCCSCPMRLRPSRLAGRSRELADIGAFDPAPAREWPSALCLDVPGRKWQQIQAFAGSLRFSQAPRHWLDWCRQGPPGAQPGPP